MLRVLVLRGRPRLRRRRVGTGIFIIRSGQVQTPMTNDGILEGVTRQAMIDLCKRLSIPCIEKTLQRHDLYIADECFLTGTAAEVAPIREVDDRPVGPGERGPITKELQQTFFAAVRGEIEQYRRWLTLVRD